MPDWGWTPARPRCRGNWAATPSTSTSRRKREPAQLQLAPGAAAQRGLLMAAAIASTRDLVNTPAEHMGPAELAEAVRLVARQHGATFKQIVGDKLLAAGFPAIHAVGRAATRAPRLIELNWGRPKDPKLVHRGQGRVLRQRRPGHQGRRRHAADEEGHGRRRQRAGPGADGDGAGAAGAAAAADPGGGERHRRQRLPAGRRLQDARRACTSRSATPTPKAASCCATRWPTAPRASRR